jgi:hypothetical protein
MSYANFIPSSGARTYCPAEDDQQPQPRSAESAGSSQRYPGNVYITNVAHVGNVIHGDNTTINMLYNVPDVRSCSSHVDDGDPFRFKRRGDHAGSSKHVRKPAQRHRMLDKVDDKMRGLAAAASTVEKNGTNEQMKRISQIQVKAKALKASIHDLLAGRAGNAPDRVLLAVSATYDDLSVLVKEAEALGTAAASTPVGRLYFNPGAKGFQVYINQ